MKDSVLRQHPYETENYDRFFDAYELVENEVYELVESDAHEFVENDAQNALYYEWHKSIINEPAMKSLAALADLEGTWVGTEGELFEKVKELTPTKAQKSGPFPSAPGELLEHVNEVYERTWVFSAAGFEVLDCRKLTDEEAEDYDVPGWGLDRPLLVMKEGATSARPRFYEALLQVARYEKPLLIAMLKSTRKQRRWSGTTFELRGRLWKYYPDVTSVWALAKPGLWHRYPDNESGRLFRSEDYLYDGDMDLFRMLDHSLDEWIGSQDDSSEHPKDLDLPELYKLVKRYSRILKQFGVKVTPKKSPTDARTLWTIEAPRWDLGDIDKVLTRFWYVSRAHAAGPRVLVGPGSISLALMPRVNLLKDQPNDEGA